MPRNLTQSTLAGILSAALFLIVGTLGFVFMFLPTLPFFVLGLSKKAEALPAAIGIAILPITLLAGLPAAILFLLFLGLPTWHMSRYSLRWRMDGAGQVQWFPIGLIILRLTLYACALTASATFYYATQPETLPQLVGQNIRAAFAGMEEEFGDVVETLAGELSFLIFPVSLWLWGILLYAHAWLANRMLARKGLQVRADFSVEAFFMPKWMLSLLAISALASLIGGESMRFLGKITTLSLMLPYFFLGVSLMHTAFKTMPSRKILLFIIYFMVASQFWPALIIAGVGLWHQLKRLVTGEKLD